MKERPLHNLFLHVGLLAGLVVFLNHLWHQSALENALLVAFGTGAAIYLVLMVGMVILQRILSHAPRKDATQKAPSDQTSATA